MKNCDKPRRAISVWSTAVIVSCSALWQGCVPSKVVTINTTPDKAHLVIYHASATGIETPFALDTTMSDSPATIPLKFDEQSHYRVEAHRVLCIPSLDNVINMDDKKDYTFGLTQYKQYTAGIVNLPTKVGDYWQLKPTLITTVATLDPVEPQATYATQPELVTRNKRTDVDYPSFTTSPAAGILVYEEIVPDSSTSTGYSSKLYKLPLSVGETPTLLTLGRKQQRFPAFDFSGDNVVFDSNDDSRSDAPFEFKTTENESSISHLEHDSETLEYYFSVAKNGVTFASYSPNATEPTIEAAGRDGSGPTPRGTGLSPQLSPDGSTIVYIHKPLEGGHYRICTVTTKGPINPVEKVQNDDYDYYDPHWSPDGKLIVFSTPSRGRDLPDDTKKEPNPKYHDAETEHQFIWVMTSDGRHSIRLTRNESFDSNPVFDRNGKTIYFRSNRGGVWNIWKLDLTDTTFTELGMAPPAQ